MLDCLRGPDDAGVENRANLAVFKQVRSFSTEADMASHYFPRAGRSIIEKISLETLAYETAGSLIDLAGRPLLVTLHHRRFCATFGTRSRASS